MIRFMIVFALTLASSMAYAELGPPGPDEPSPQGQGNPSGSSEGESVEPCDHPCQNLGQGELVPADWLPSTATKECPGIRIELWNPFGPDVTLVALTSFECPQLETFRPAHHTTKRKNCFNPVYEEGDPIKMRSVSCGDGTSVLVVGTTYCESGPESLSTSRQRTCTGEVDCLLSE